MGKKHHYKGKERASGFKVQQERASPGSWHICTAEQSLVTKSTFGLWYPLWMPLFLHTLDLVAGMCCQTCLKETSQLLPAAEEWPSHADPAVVRSPYSWATMSPVGALQLVGLAEVSGMLLAFSLAAIHTFRAGLRQPLVILGCCAVSSLKSVPQTGI